MWYIAAFLSHSGCSLADDVMAVANNTSMRNNLFISSILPKVGRD